MPPLATLKIDVKVGGNLVRIIEGQLVQMDFQGLMYMNLLRCLLDAVALKW